jgi:hypothetical protein
MKIWIITDQDPIFQFIFRKIMKFPTINYSVFNNFIKTIKNILLHINMLLFAVN